MRRAFARWAVSTKRSATSSARDLGAGGIPPVAVRVGLGARTMLEAGMIDLHLGNLDAARHHLEHANGLAVEHLTRAERIEGLGGLALVEYVQSGLETATRLSAEALALATGPTLRQTGFSAPALVAQSLVAVDRKPFSYTAAAYRRLAARRLAEGLDFLQQARHGYRSWSPPGLGLSVAELMHASLVMHLDQGDEAWAILRDLPVYEHHILCPARVSAQLRLRHGDLRGASEALEGCEQIAAHHSQRTLVDVRMLRAAIEVERGNEALADVSFDRALAALTHRAMTRGHSGEAARILSHVAEATEGQARAIEPLSHRELLVLAEVEKGATVADIATALFISPNTVKTHLRRLYRKLGVTTRADAIRKTKSLGLGRPITRKSPE